MLALIGHHPETQEQRKQVEMVGRRVQRSEVLAAKAADARGHMLMKHAEPTSATCSPIPRFTNQAEVRED